MPVRTARAVWNDNLNQGSGTVSFGSFEGKYSFASRFEDGSGTNPEELVGAAHAGCFSMALALVLGEAGYEPASIRTSAEVHLDGDALAITKVVLCTEAEVPNLSDEAFQQHAEAAKENCPVSKALAGVEIVLKAGLASEAS